MRNSLEKGIYESRLTMVFFVIGRRVRSAYMGGIKCLSNS